MGKGGGDGEESEVERKRRLIGAGTHDTLGGAALCDRNASGFDYIHGSAGLAFENNVLSSFVASDPVSEHGRRAKREWSERRQWNRPSTNKHAQFDQNDITSIGDACQGVRAQCELIHSRLLA